MMKLKIQNIKVENTSDHGNILKSLKIENEYYKMKYISINKKKVLMIVSEIIIGGVGLAAGSTLTISGLATAGIVCSGGISFLSSISTLITNYYFSKLKLRCTKLREWIFVNTLLYEKL